MSEIWLPISTFLGGVIVTLVVFILPFTNKVTALSVNIKAVSDANEILFKRLDAHIATTPVCNFHQEIASEQATSKAERVAIEQRITKIEQKDEKH